MAQSHSPAPIRRTLPTGLHATLSVGRGVRVSPPLAEWILATGAWSDSGKWANTATWTDS